MNATGTVMSKEAKVPAFSGLVHQENTYVAVDTSLPPYPCFPSESRMLPGFYALTDWQGYF